MMDLQWIFQLSAQTVSRLVRSVQRQCTIIVPTPGTILDAGRSMTHKDIVIKLYLQGRTVQEIAKMTYHSPRSVDNYIDAFESVLILHLYRLPRKLMSRILKKGVSLIDEHLKLAERYFRGEEEIREFVTGKEARA